MTTHNTLLQLDNVGVSYTTHVGLMQKKEFWALKDVSFSIKQGETIGIIGRNGAGKSSLLKILAGIISPTRGSITYNTDSVVLLSLQAGFVPYLTGRQNAMLSGMLLGLSKKEMGIRINDIISFAELVDFIDEPLRTYSAGMKARLGFSVAIQADPEILLIDEILGVGDMAFREKSSEALHSRIKSNRTAVVVSHQMQTIKELCDKVLWIENRETRLFGEPDEVIEQYLETGPREKKTQTR